ncbi:DoxX family protein [Coleofasciculus sp. FACHB-T130]|uniref:DoxX family protein n=1 Tax=Cyanophyceae TaxID=3028117 RepID=UPI001685AAFD|nr:DoxX family protein [Coleofasciculus sp. FACHB-T130]MBD1880090.1 DoxX family protein [Coleofasciculus sp. FACHB-T130]
MEKYIPLIARAFLAAIFLKSGFDKITGFSGTQQFMAKNGIPLALTGLLLVAAIILELAGGLSVVLGYKARWGAIALIIFMIPATLIFHTDFDDRMQVIAFMKNLAIIGGLLMVYYIGSGPISLDEQMASKRSD